MDIYTETRRYSFCLLVNTRKPKFVAFLVFVCTSASVSAQISSSQNALKRDDILAPVAKQLMAKDIFRVTGANQNARKLLFADLVNTGNIIIIAGSK